MPGRAVIFPPPPPSSSSNFIIVFLTLSVCLPDLCALTVKRSLGTRHLHTGQPGHYFTSRNAHPAGSGGLLPDHGRQRPAGAAPGQGPPLAVTPNGSPLACLGVMGMRCPALPRGEALPAHCPGDCLRTAPPPSTRSPEACDALAGIQIGCRTDGRSAGFPAQPSEVDRPHPW